MTQIRNNPYFYFALDAFNQVDPALTEEIVKDERIPKSFLDIELKDLPVFAEWQRKVRQRHADQRQAKAEEHHATVLDSESR